MGHVEECEEREERDTRVDTFKSWEVKKRAANAEGREN